MRRTLIRIAFGLGSLVIVAICLAWARPDLLAAIPPRLREWKTWVIESASQFRGSAEVATRDPQTAAGTEEEPVEMIDDGWCALHRLPEEECPECPLPGAAEDGAPRPCAELLPIVTLASAEVADRIGLETTRAEARMHADTIQGTAELVYNDHRYAEVWPRVAGLVREVGVDHGDVVEQGSVIGTIDSAEVGTAKAAYLAALPVAELAQATLERTRSLTRANALPMKDELEAQAAFNTAQADVLNAAQRLKNLGFTDSDLVRISTEQDTSSLLKLVAPIGGTVVERHAVPGEAVEPNHALATIADIRTIWAWIDVYEDEIERVQAGQPVMFHSGPGQREETLGVVEWIDTAVNPATRTIRVRAELPNPDGRLRANQFGLAEIQIGKLHRALFLPKEAIQVVYGENLVFLPQPGGLYHPQRLLLESGENLRGEVEVLWGVEEGQEVVTTGSFLLKSELLRDELAGD